jgi:predicted dienelactone hydrolase
VAEQKRPLADHRRLGIALELYMKSGFAFLFYAITTSLLTAGNPVGMVIRQYADPSRPNWRAAGPRPEMTVVWYPAVAGTAMTIAWDKSPPPFAGSFVVIPVAPDAPLAPSRERYPLILLSHGATSVPWSLMWLGVYLASHGYIAAALVHHGDTGYEGEPLAQGFVLMSERAKDMSVVLDRLLADPMFGERIDPERIGAAGHSSGGETVIALAGGIFDPENIRKYCQGRPQSAFCAMPPEIRAKMEKFEELRKKDGALAELYAHQNLSYRDPRVRAVFAMAPAVGPGFTQAGLDPVKIPVSIVVGSADVITPPDEHAAYYAKLIRGAKLTVIPRAGHMIFGGECTAQGRKTLAVLCVDDPSVDRHRVLQRVAGDALTFFNANLGVQDRRTR